MLFIACLLLLSVLVPGITGNKSNFQGRAYRDKKVIFNNINEDEISEINIIISPPNFYNAAKELEEFHDELGTPTIIINTTWIYQKYGELAAPEYRGYSNRLIPRLFVKEYDFSLSKKIVNFLRDTQYHPNLEYVTLLGNGHNIPPSYYLHSQGRMTKRILLFLQVPYIYNNIVATDFFYTSPDYDLNPDYKVGRLPVSNENEAIEVVRKIINWRENADWDWFQNVYVGGDQPNLPEEMNLRGCYAGEMIAVDAINRDLFEHMPVTKLFWTEGLFNKESIINALDEGNSGFMYMMAHGFVDRWGTYKEFDPYVYADDLLTFQENNNIPIIVSVACMSGAYDTYLTHPYNIQKGTTSFGEAVLLSKGAGIAYVGTTRATLGSPLLYLDGGEVVITKERGIAGMLTYFFEAYKQGTNRLGDLTNKAIEKYISENVFPDDHPERDNDFIVLASFVLLGDPALDIPIFEELVVEKQSYLQPHISAIDPEGYTTEEYSRPWYYEGSEITLCIESDSPEVNIKRIDINRDEVVERATYYPEEDTLYYTFTANDVTEYLIRAESLDGKESWFYLTIIKRDDSKPVFKILQK